MARTFASGDTLPCSVGGMGTSTHGTWAALVRRGATGAWHTMAALHSSGGSALQQFAFNDSNAVALWIDGTTVTGPSWSSTTAWCLVVVRKATGTATPRFSICDLSTGTWTHQNASGTLPNWAAPTSGTVRLEWETFDRYVGDVAVRAAWNNSLPWSADATGDALLEAAGLQFDLWSWFASSPSAVWVFDQSATTQNVLDMTGGGAGQSSVSGTSVASASVPGFSYGADMFEVLAVTSGATDATATPAAIATTSTLPAPSLSTGSVVTPSAIATVSTLPAPTVSGSSTVTASAIATVSTLPAPTVQTGATVTPSAIATSSTLPAPSLQTGQTVTPAAIATVSTLPAPTVTAGVIIEPSAIATVSTLPAPSLSTGSTVTPTAIATASTLPAPTLSVGTNATPTPAAIATVSTLPAPTVQTGSRVSATAIATVIEFPAPTVSGSATTTPAAIATVSTLPAPTLSAGSTVLAGAIATVTTLPVPTVTGNLLSGIAGNAYPRTGSVPGGTAVTSFSAVGDVVPRDSRSVAGSVG